MLLANTQNHAGTITLPSATSNAGRTITCKDIGGYADVSTITMSTIQGEMFEDGYTTRSINQPYGFETFIASASGKWYTLGATEYYNFGASTATFQKTLCSSIQTPYISATTMEGDNAHLSSLHVFGTISTNQIHVYGPSTLVVQGLSQFNGQILNSVSISTPSLIASTIQTQYPMKINQTLQPFIQYGISSFQASQFPIVLPVKYANSNYAIQITGSDGTNQTLVPHASTISVSSFYAHGTSPNTFYWTTFGLI